MIQWKNYLRCKRIKREKMTSRIALENDVNRTKFNYSMKWYKNWQWMGDEKWTVCDLWVLIWNFLRKYTRRIRFKFEIKNYIKKLKKGSTFSFTKIFFKKIWKGSFHYLWSSFAEGNNFSSSLIQNIWKKWNKIFMRV